MPEYNPKNERIKREYFRYLGEAEGKSPTTLDGIRKSILRFEQYNRLKDFSTFNKDQAIAFKKHLAEVKSERSEKKLSPSTILSTLNHLKPFFRWLMQQPSYKTKIRAPDINYLNLTDKETRIAQTSKFKNFPTLEQIRKVIFSMPTETEIERRDRALIAFTTLTGMRDGATPSLRLKHVDLESKLIKQEPDLVRTKFGKRIDTFFFPVGDEIQKVFVDWVKELREQKLYGMNDPVFPKTKKDLDQNHCFTYQGLEATCWTSASSIRDIFREAFQNAGLEYFNPHSFRNTLTDLGQRICKTPEEFKAWSQNLGHEDVMTTFSSYGNISAHRQGEVIRNLRKLEDEDKIDFIFRTLKKDQNLLDRHKIGL